MEIALILAVIAAIFIVRTFKIVPQQNAWVVEKLGKYDRTLTPGLKFVMPFVERVAYKHSLKEVPLDVPSQVCITKVLPPFLTLLVPVDNCVLVRSYEAASL